MKKNYLQPMTIIVNIETEAMFCESVAVKGDAGDMNQLSRESDWED